jgi:hypothetical protein
MIPNQPGIKSRNEKQMKEKSKKKRKDDAYCVYITLYIMATCTAEPNVPFCDRVTSRYSFMIDPIIHTGADASLGVVVYVRTTTPIFTTACHPRTGARLLNFISNLPVEPPSSVHLLSQTVRRRALRPASSVANLQHTRHQGVDANAIGRQQLAQPLGGASLEDRSTHLRHSSSFHRPPSLRCASVEPDRPGAYGAPGSSRRLSA